MTFRRNKYHNTRTLYNGVTYDSKTEARFAAMLDMLRKAKKPEDRVVEVERQPKFELSPAPDRIIYRADFKVTYADGHVEVYDVKGVETKEFKIKKKLMNQKYPEVDLKLVFIWNGVFVYEKAKNG